MDWREGEKTPMSRLLLKNGRVVDPSQKLDGLMDVLIEDGMISALGMDLTAREAEVMDITGKIVAPGFVDMHVHLREPGKEEAETIRTGTLAAAAGGFTAVACMPNTTPVNDSIDVTEFIRNKAKEEAAVSVYPIAAVTKGQAGEQLVAMSKLKDAGAIAFSDDGRPVFDSRVMRLALEQSVRLGIPVIDHCEDRYLFQGGCMNEGPISVQLELKGIPAAAEEIMVSRNVLLSKLTGGHVHLAHMSTQGSMELIRRAKGANIHVTAEVTPHHFTLTEEAVTRYGTNAKMNPPLRTGNDVRAVLSAIADGTVDVIASDHAPHHADTKKVNFDRAAFGIIGLETSVALGLDRLVHAGVIGLERFIELYSLNPARILGISRGIVQGNRATLTILDLNRSVRVEANQFQSKSRNTPFDGWTLKGSPVATICDGVVVYGR